MLMVIIELYIGLRPATFPPMTQVGVVDFRFSLLIYILLKNVRGDERDDISGDDGRLVFRYQYTSHSYFQNI